MKRKSECMELVRGLYNIKQQHQNSVITLGSFDGIHLGHQHVINTVIEFAKQHSVASGLVTFEPLPKEYFMKLDAPARITSLREKLLCLKKTALNYVMCLRFNDALAKLTAEEFVKTILVEQLKVRTVVVGEDFHFGHQRRGNITLLQQMGQHYNFDVKVIKKIAQHDCVISSTHIRHALKTANFAEVENCLGRTYQIAGRVIYGAQRGRLLGFPTANIRLKRLVSPLHGVYAVQIVGYENKVLSGVANVGIRPTINDKQWLLEVHVFDFDANLYGAHLQIEFIKKIRDEQKFESLDSLREQIAKDVAAAKKI
jgi:riboflavin kinase/FMN adenylyltransferase